MLFAIHCLDKPGHSHLRQELLDVHRAHFQTAGDAVRAAGPMFTDDGETQCGSLIVYEAADANAARAFIEADPYARGGLFEHVTVRRWAWMSGAGKPEA